MRRLDDQKNDFERFEDGSFGYFAEPPFFGLRELVHFEKELFALPYFPDSIFAKNLPFIYLRVPFPGVFWASGRG